MSKCYRETLQEEAQGCDHGFMGMTHALSGAALFLFLAAFFPLVSIQALGTDNKWVFALALVVTAGAALLPDLDNSASTAKSSLGYLGDGLSVLFRSTSSVLQTTVRLKRDDDSPNPHRGFYHTLPGAALLGLLVFLGTRMTTGELVFPWVGTLTHGGFFALIIAWLHLHMALAGLAKDITKKIKKKAGPFGELVALLVSFTLTFLLFGQLPKDLDYWWLGVSVALGCLIHILGDMFTTAGVPILFPLPIRGKLWWTVRLTPIRAGGVVEKYLFTPVFLGVIVVSLIKMLLPA